MEVLLFIGGTFFGLIVGSIAGFGSAMTKIEQARQEGFMMAFSNFAEVAQRAAQEERPKAAPYPTGKKTN